jgi:hypothetical protein
MITALGYRVSRINSIVSMSSRPTCCGPVAKEGQWLKFQRRDSKLQQ